MVKVKNEPHIHEDGSIDLEAWLDHLSNDHFQAADIRLIRNACFLAQLAGYDKPTTLGTSCLQEGLRIAEVVSDLDMDQQTLAAGIVYPSVEFAELSLEDVEEQLGFEVKKLVEGVQRMAAVDLLQQSSSRQYLQIDNVRKMMLAMVDDVRVVLIKLAERLQTLRGMTPFTPATQKQIAMEAMNIYAPLANRLGIGQIKWEMEDLAFRYIDPEKYKSIAKGLRSKRVERDEFVSEIVEKLETELTLAGIQDFEVYGRSKHIHSIFRKMQRKNVDLTKIYDATAVRALVQTQDDCYQTMSIVHNLWESIPEEFDDYISNPKQNGYRSLHTAVRAPKNRVFEVQIRTYEMHKEAELGVAAHWLYKEGGQLKQASHERKIEWLRQVLAWQKELSSIDDYANVMQPEALEDRVYVFTPNGDILDLQLGSTVLDFAYAIHSEVGHRCRGAKINGQIAPLSSPIKTGDQVEILTAKQGGPSRDWLNNNLGYLKTSRARAKVHHWFRLQDFEENVNSGREILEKELTKLHMQNTEHEKIAKQLNFKTIDEFLASLGRGELRRSTLVQSLTPPKPKTKLDPVNINNLPDKDKSSASSDVYIHGVGNLMTHIARCCHPVPGDEIIGYITLGRGISIHKKNCSNVQNANSEQLERLIEVEWGEKPKEQYEVELIITAYDRSGLIHDIATLLNQERVSLQSLSTKTDKSTQKAKMHLTLEVYDLVGLSRLIDRVSVVRNVLSVDRV